MAQKRSYRKKRNRKSRFVKRRRRFRRKYRKTQLHKKWARDNGYSHQTQEVGVVIKSPLGRATYCSCDYMGLGNWASIRAHWDTIVTERSLERNLNAQGIDMQSGSIAGALNSQEIIDDTVIDRKVCFYDFKNKYILRNTGNHPIIAWTYYIKQKKRDQRGGYTFRNQDAGIVTTDTTGDQTHLPIDYIKFGLWKKYPDDIETLVTAKTPTHTNFTRTNFAIDVPITSWHQTSDIFNKRIKIYKAEKCIIGPGGFKEFTITRKRPYHFTPEDMRGAFQDAGPISLWKAPLIRIQGLPVFDDEEIVGATKGVSVDEATAVLSIESSFKMTHNNRRYHTGMTSWNPFPSALDVSTVASEMKQVEENAG